MDINSPEFHDWCIDHEVRIDWIVPIGCDPSDGRPDGPLADWLDLRSEDELFKMFPEAKADGLVFEDPDDNETQAIFDYIAEARIFGFVLHASTPVRRHQESGTVYYSWGYVHTVAVRADNLVDILVKLDAWAMECDASDKKESSAIPAAK